MNRKAIVSNLVGEDTNGIIAVAREEGCAVEHVLPYGILIEGNRNQLLRLEKSGYRVKILTDVGVLEVGDHRILTVEDNTAGLSPQQLKIWSHFLLQLIAPPAKDWIVKLEQLGLDVVEPVSAYGLFVVGNMQMVDEAVKLPYVSWAGPFLPQYRLHNSTWDLSGTVRYISIAAYPPDRISKVADAVINYGGKVIRETVPPFYYYGQYGELLVEMAAENIKKIAQLPAVRWIEYAPPQAGLEGEREAQIVAGNLNSAAYPDKSPLPGYTGWLEGLGIDGGSGVKVAICDSGVDTNDKNNKTGHRDLLGRQNSFLDYGDGDYCPEDLAHGTHVASIAVGSAGTGQKDGDGFYWGQGVAPRAEYVNQNILLGPWPPDWQKLVRDAAVKGAQVMNNSWCSGKAPGDGYTLPARTFDRLIRDAVPGTARPRGLAVIFSAGNAGPGSFSITPPKELKNAIVVGNSLNYNPDKRFRCKDIRGVFGASSRGPARDGRILPTVVAPGTDVAAALSQGSRRTPIVGSGDKVHRSTNRYVYMTGTSMSAPLISGACALLIEWWRRRTGGKDPSPAMLKALLINGAENQAGGQDWRCISETGEWIMLEDGSYCRPLEFYPLEIVSGYETMTAVKKHEALEPGEWHYSAKDQMLYVRMPLNFRPMDSSAPLLYALAPHPLGSLPDNTQGWGRVSLNNILLQSPASDRGAKIFIDEEHTFTATGQQYVLKVAPADSSLPMRFTLVWTDAPASPGSGRVLVNDLDLEVQEIDGKNRIYKGNVFAGGYSRAGGHYDALNNVECVYLQKPAGVYEVRVVASALRALAKPPFGCRKHGQDFALVIDNAEQVSDKPVNLFPVVEQCKNSQEVNNILKVACKQLLVSLRAGDSVGLTDLETDCSQARSQAIRTITGRSIRKSTGSRLLVKSKGCKSGAGGLMAAANMAAGIKGEKSLILFSGAKQEGCLQCVDNGQKQLRDKQDLNIHTCALGPHANHYYLAELAAAHHGRYFYAPDASYLAEVCNYLRAELTGHGVVLNETVKGSGGAVSALVEENAEEVTFTFFWPDVPKKVVHDPRHINEIGVRLTSPDGQQVHPNSSWLYRQDGAGHVLFRIMKPRPGYWKLQLLAGREMDIQYTVSALVKSSLHLQLDTSVYQSTLKIMAHVKEKDAALTGWRPFARLLSANVSKDNVRFNEIDGGKEQGAIIDCKDISGPCNLLLLVDGISSVTGTPFRRLKMISLPPLRF
ncbi:S8 family serine peptidase [Dethiobacter alkaliphilus]|uniref:Peptidase S8 and S53 subtilisin kexin sedolisin n=1 Tax=Dethiobacter alkaliphilus AHT 1 TaxID=555088 RepID=C0GK18_DETAL|nr:S8 family serine peptidase [Dethiobacter alkaliphilus]EEG76288.1 peptidase S8 and S53 subtilisin kexin sedolisin [Dethiobacter alkaliphilus AHT 1]